MHSASSTAAARRAIRIEPADAELRCELARWALAEGRSMNIDAATAILAARGTFSGASGARRHHWTSAAVRQTLLTIVPQLWRLHGLGPVPPLADSMRTYLCFLDTCGLLSPHSESIVDLLDATTSADISARRRVDPTELGPLARVVPLGAASGQVRPK